MANNDKNSENAGFNVEDLWKIEGLLEITPENFQTEVIESSYDTLVHLYYHNIFTLSCHRQLPVIQDLAAENLNVKIVHLIAVGNSLCRRLDSTLNITLYPVHLFYRNGKIVEVIKDRKDEEFFRKLYAKQKK